MKKRNPKARLGHARLAPPDDVPTYEGLGDDAPAAPAERGGSVCGPALPKATMQLCLKRTATAPGKAINGPDDVCRLMRGFEDAAQENFTVLHLDVRHRVTGIDNMAKGSLTGVEVHPREVLKAALLNSSASLILVHNHPSGESTPSRQDIELTNRLRQGAELVGIQVLDHIIVAREGCVGLAARGFMGEPLVGNKYSKPPRGK
jgi:DNA repair protein RadC